MARSCRCAFILAILLAVALRSAHAASATLVSIKTPRGANQAFILIKPERPVASVILFAGGHGRLGLKSASSMTGEREIFWCAAGTSSPRMGSWWRWSMRLPIGRRA